MARVRIPLLSTLFSLLFLLSGFPLLFNQARLTPNLPFRGIYGYDEARKDSFVFLTI